MNNQNKSYLFAILAILLWSTVATAFKISLKNVNYVQLLFYASLISFLTIATILIYQNLILRSFKCSLKEYLTSALLGFLNPFLYYLVLLKAYSLLPAQIALPLNYTWPIVLVVLSIPILGQKMKLRNFIAIIVSFLGVVAISMQGNILNFQSSSIFGIILAAGSSIIWATFWLLNMKDYRQEEIKLFWNFFFGFLFTLIYSMLTNNLIVPSIEGLIAVSYVGLFEMGITFTLWLKALQLTSTTSKISNLVFISPFLSLIFIHFFLGESIYYTTIIGLILIVAGIIIEKTSKQTSL